MFVPHDDPPTIRSGAGRQCHEQAVRLQKQSFGWHAADLGLFGAIDWVASLHGGVGEAHAYTSCRVNMNSTFWSVTAALVIPFHSNCARLRNESFIYFVTLNDGF